MKLITRIISAFGVLILLAIVVLFILSRSGDAGKMHHSIDIATSPEKLFSWVEQGDKAKKWVGWLVETRPVGTNNSGVGAREIWVMKDPNMGDQLIPIEGTCTEYKPPSRLSVRLESPAFQGNQTYLLSPIGANKTRLEVDGRYEFSGWFAKLMTPLIMPAARKKMDGDLAHLKQLLEAE